MRGMKTILLVVLGFVSFSAFAQRPEGAGAFEPGWKPSVRGAALHTFDADLEGEGSFSVDRVHARAALTYLLRPDRAVTLSVGRGEDLYRFSSESSFDWSRVESWRAGAFVRWGLENGWTLFAAPGVRSVVESGARWQDGLTGAFFGGASYSVDRTFSIGPGFGVAGQLEDETRIFPALVIRWQANDQLRVETGSGFAATAGPGIMVDYALSRKWRAGLAMRYERKRFRREDAGSNAEGVVQDRYWSYVASFGCAEGRDFDLRVVFGVNFGGELGEYASGGRLLREIMYDESVFAGASVRYSF